jgi:hypothetical protein
MARNLIKRIDYNSPVQILFFHLIPFGISLDDAPTGLRPLSAILAGLLLEVVIQH